MIIGNGLIAKSFKKEKFFFKDVIIFASGISNSKNIDLYEFQKEMDLIKKILKKKNTEKFIYFSSLDVYRNVKTPYIRHKINIEKLLIKEKNVLIVRLPQLIGNSKNEFTLFNYFRFNLKKNKKIIIFKNFYRNFIDVDDLVKSTKKLNLKKNNFKILNIFNAKSIKIIDVLQFFIKQKIVKNRLFELNLKKDLFYYDTSKFYNEKCMVVDKKNYYQKLFKKYTLQ